MAWSGWPGHRFAVGVVATALAAALLPAVTAVATDAPPPSLTEWGSQGSGDGEFERPEGVAVDSNNHVYVADVGNRRIQKFLADGAFLISWGSRGSGDGEFEEPWGIAIDSQGNVLVTDRTNDNVQKFDADGAFLASWGGSGTGPGEFDAPLGIAVDSQDNVYVADGDNDRIQKFDIDGVFLDEWGDERGSDPGEFSFPTGVAVDSQDNVYVADTDNDRVQKLTADGAFLTEWGERGSGPGEFDIPRGVAVDSDDHVYVADDGNDRVQKFDANGAFLTEWGERGSGPGQFQSPRGVAVNSRDNVYVSGRGNHRIQKFGVAAPRDPVTMMVNSTADRVDVDPGDGSCDTGEVVGPGDEPECTLRAAVMEANAAASHDAIVLPDPMTVLAPGDAYTLTIPGRDEDAGETGDLDVVADVDITGAGADGTVIDADGLDRVFDIRGGATVTLAGVTVTGGDARSEGSRMAGEGGGGIRVGEGATLSLAAVTVTGNTAGENQAEGGGIANYRGTVEMVASRIDGNEAPACCGGGIYNEGGAVTLTDSSVDDNRAEDCCGGGIFNRSVIIFDEARVIPATLTITNSTVDGNEAPACCGGGIFNDGGAVTLTDSSVDDNRADECCGGGIFSEGRHTSVVESAAVLTLTRSSVDRNIVEECCGGGIFARPSSFADPDNSQLMIVDSSVSDNELRGDSAFDGGGILNTGDLEMQGTTVSGNRIDRCCGGGLEHGGGTAQIQNSTFSGNTAVDGDGAGILGSNMALVNVTITGNVSEDRPAGGLHAGTNTTAVNTIIANNTGADCSGALISLGHNLDSDGTCTLDPSENDVPGTDPLLGPLADNGGPTLSHALMLGSPALGAADPNACPDTDQRGVSRPLGAGCDMGAFERSTGALAGTVTAADTGAGVEGATVTATRNPSADTTTDADGEYLLDGLEADMYTVAVEADGYDTAVIDDVAVTAGAVTTLDVALDVALDVEPDPDPDPDPSADVWVTKSADTAAARIGGLVRFDVTVGNDGPDTAAGVVATDTLPDGLAFADVTPPGACTHAAGTLTCAIGDLAAGAQAAARVTVTPVAAGSQTNTVAVTTDTDDPDSGNNTATATVVVDAPDEPTERVAGATRIETAVEASRTTFADGEAQVVVLARSDAFPDALAGSPLAVALQGPLLLTQPSGLHPATEAELIRVLPPGGTVHLLGGPVALSDAVADRVRELGFTTLRHGGADRFATAALIADAIPDPAAVFLATGHDFPDALAAGAAAARRDGVILLTIGARLAEPTQAWIDARPALPRFAAGGPAAAADPGATPLAGADRFHTAALVAAEVFPAPSTVGIATGIDFADALAGAAHIGRRSGPMLLAHRTFLPAPAEDYLRERAVSVHAAFLYGGPAALSGEVEDAVRDAMTPG